MANLYILPDSWLIALTLWTFLSLAAESFLVYYQSPLPSFQNTRQRLVEGAQLLLLLLIFDLLHDGMGGHSTGVTMMTKHEALRTVLVVITSALNLYGGKEDKRN